MRRWLSGLGWLMIAAFSGCEGKGDPCAGVSCDEPPASTCNLDQLMIFAKLGNCQDGMCIYPSTPRSCPDGCKDGACLDNPTCEGVVCDHPPADSCDGTEFILRYPRRGVCDSGTFECVYSPTKTPCPLGCANDVCPECNSAADCPLVPSDCLDDDRQVSFQPHCRTHSCQQSPIIVDCTAGGRSCQEGRCVSAWPAPVVGEVLVTEFIANPKAVGDSSGEWFEILSLASGRLDLSGVRVSGSGSNLFTISPEAAFPIEPGARLVLGINGDQATNGGVEVDYDYAGFSLGNTLGAIVLTAPGGDEIDGVRYDSAGDWVIPEGASLFLKDDALSATGNDDPAKWCPALDAYGNGDFGTPGASGGACRECFVAADCPVSLPSCQGSERSFFTAACNSGLCEETAQVENCAELGLTCQLVGCVSLYRSPLAGEVVISEFMADSDKVSDANGEWLELANISTETLELGGLVVHDDGGQRFTIPKDRSHPIPGGGRFVLAVQGDPALNGGLIPDFVYNYNGFSLGNSAADAIVIELPGLGVLDAVRYDKAAGWEILPGMSNVLMEAFMDANANDDLTHWCRPLETYGAGDSGTPGVAGGTCRECFLVADCPATPPFCQSENELMFYSSACNQGLCEEAAEVKDCVAAGMTCRDAACVSPFRAPALGEIVLSEFMADPAKVADNNGEWFEVANVSGETLELGGLVVHDDGGQRFTIPTERSYPIPVDGRFVLAIQGELAINGGLNPNFVYSGFTLGNLVDAIVIELPAEVVLDAVRFDLAKSWLIAPGKSNQLREEFLNPIDNDNPANWCQTTLTYGLGDYGTPGAQNLSCSTF